MRYRIQMSAPSVFNSDQPYVVYFQAHPDGADLQPGYMLTSMTFEANTEAEIRKALDEYGTLMRHASQEMICRITEPQADEPFTVEGK